MTKMIHHEIGFGEQLDDEEPAENSRVRVDGSFPELWVKVIGSHSAGD